MVSLKWIIQNLLPPALLSFLGRSWYLSVTEIDPLYISRDLGFPILGKAYSGFSTLAISTISILYLRLYFLPSNQSRPTIIPPEHITEGRRIYECAEHQNRGNLLEPWLCERPVLGQCEKSQCRGRWKPPRTRHCSECGTCRMGFDHHCAFFANCLTAPYIPTFLLTLLYTAPTVFILSAPLLRPLATRACSAYRLSWKTPDIVEGWYGWTWSWLIAGGPVGRYVGGLVLGWKELDRQEGVRMLRLEVGALVAVGLVLASMTLGLAISTIETILKGDLTVDRERAKSFARLKADIDRLIAAGRPVGDKMKLQMAQLTAQAHFWIPIDLEDDLDMTTHSGRGMIVPTLPGERPYDMGRRGNWELYMGPRLGWLLPWNAWRRSEVIKRIVHDWPINRGVEMRMREEALAFASRMDVGGAE